MCAGRVNGWSGLQVPATLPVPSQCAWACSVAGKCWRFHHVCGTGGVGLSVFCLSFSAVGARVFNRVPSVLAVPACMVPFAPRLVASHASRHRSLHCKSCQGLGPHGIAAMPAHIFGHAVVDPVICSSNPQSAATSVSKFPVCWDICQGWKHGQLFGKLTEQSRE